LYIYIKGVLFLPLRLQHLPDMLLMLGDSHIAVFGPILPQFVVVLPWHLHWCLGSV